MSQHTLTNEEDGRDKLHELRKMVASTLGGKEVVAVAETWAKHQAAFWPYGTYSPNDLTTMYEAGFYRGYLAGARKMIDRHEAECDHEWTVMPEEGVEACERCARVQALGRD